MAEDARHVTINAWCPWGHFLELQAEVREEGPDGEVVTLTVDASETVCAKCGCRLGDDRED